MNWSKTVGQLLLVGVLLFQAWVLAAGWQDWKDKPPKDQFTYLMVGFVGMGVLALLVFSR